MHRFSYFEIARVRLLMLVVVALCSTAARAQDFSAEVVSLKGASPFPTKIFATKGKLRFQQQDRTGQPSSVLLVDLHALTSVVLMPQQHLYIEQSRPQIPGQGVAFFQPPDPENACAAWQKMAELKGTCRNLGEETVHERQTVKYETVAADKSTSYIWIDTRLHFPIKWEGATIARELHNIVEGPQAAELFAIPRGYTKRRLGAAQ